MPRRLGAMLTKLGSMVKRANQRMRQLESSGYTSSSMYTAIRDQFIKDKPDYMTYTENGEMKFRTDLTKMTEKEINDLQSRVTDFLDAKTSTVRGEKRARKQAFETSKKKFIREMTPDEQEMMKTVSLEMKISQDDYLNLWKSTAIQSAKSMYGSDKVFTMITKSATNMSADKIQRQFELAIKKNNDQKYVVERRLGLKFDKSGNIAIKKKRRKR